MLAQERDIRNQEVISNQVYKTAKADSLVRKRYSDAQLRA